MAHTTETNDVSHDRCLYPLYRMGFESARVDHTASRAHISDYRSDDRFICYLDGSGETGTKKDGQIMANVIKYFKRIWCAILNKKCHEDCDCNVK